MIDSIIITNQSNGNSVVLDRDSSDYLIDDDGLDWGKVSSSFSTVGTLDNYGSTITAIDTQQPRPINIIGWVAGTESQMAKKKSRLSKVITPNDTIRIEIPRKSDPTKIYFIDTIMNDSLHYDNTYRANNEVMCRFSLSLIAPYPYFEYPRREIFSTGGTLINNGDIPVGLYAEFDSSGEGSNFTISNGHQIAIFEALRSGNFKINTQYGARSVLLSSQKAFKYMSPNYGWVFVPQGTCSVETDGELILQFNEAYTVLEDC